jgi:glycosyltransferase involved in cell wall biosynthesis
MLAELGAEVRLATFCTGPLPDRMAARGVRTRIVPRRFKYDPACVGLLARNIKEDAIDLIHTHGFLANVVGLAAAARVPGVAGIATIHGLPEPFAGLDAAKMRLNLFLERRLVKRRAAAVIAVSAAVEKWVLSWGVARDRVRIVRNGIHSPEPDPGMRARMRAELSLSDADVAACFLSRLEPVKRPLLFVEMACRALKRRPEAVFVVIGEGPLLEPMREAAAAAGCGERFRFLGFRNDVDQVLSAMDLLVNTSEIEGVPISLLEAMGHGAAPVAFAVGGLAEVIEHGRTGILVPAHDADRFVEELSGLLADPHRRRALSEAAAAAVRERFSDRTMAERTMEAYGEARRRKSSP